MTSARLSPAMRNMLRAAIAGRTGSNGETRAALIARGMLTDAGLPTPAGHAYFKANDGVPIRRPAVAAMAERLLRQHPDWTENDAIGHAKGILTSRGPAC